MSYSKEAVLFFAKKLLGTTDDTKRAILRKYTRNTQANRNTYVSFLMTQDIYTNGKYVKCFTNEAQRLYNDLPQEEISCHY